MLSFYDNQGGSSVVAPPFFFTIKNVLFHLSYTFFNLKINIITAILMIDNLLVIINAKKILANLCTYFINHNVSCSFSARCCYSSSRRFICADHWYHPGHLLLSSEKKEKKGTQFYIG